MLSVVVIKAILSIACLLLVSPVLGASELAEVSGCVLVETEWADGDSFLVRTPDGEERTVRLYGADCFEWHVTDESDARRLREQRRYFGITTAGGSPAESIALAKSYGEEAYREIVRLLEKPFTIHTSYADARGDGKYQRIYAFITMADGVELSEHLVTAGLARAFGVCRSTYDGRSRDEYRAHLSDLELLAARRSTGVWASTEWEKLANERMEQRIEDEELALATGSAGLEPGEKVDVNRAARDQLMRLPGIGETLAHRIIEARPMASTDDLGKVDGIGAATLKQLAPFLEFTP